MKIMNKILKSTLGFGFVEILVSFALLGVASYAIFTGIDYITSSKSAVDQSVSLGNMIMSVVESVRANIIFEKIDFQAEQTFLNNTTYQAVKDSLKMRFTKDGILSEADCPNCAGRIGYVVTPYKVGNLEMRGLYKVTIRMTHDELFPNNFQNYEFIVRGP